MSIDMIVNSRLSSATSPPRARSHGNDGQPSPHDSSRFNPAGILFFKYWDESSKYGAPITFSYPEAREDFETAANSLSMTADQKLASISVTLKVYARRYYTNNLTPKSQTFYTATNSISQKFNSTAQQHLINNYILLLSSDQMPFPLSPP